MPPSDATRLEEELQRASFRGDFGRLYRFATWCAEQTVHPKMPVSWRNALALAGKRAQHELTQDEFRVQREQAMEDLPVAATAIGLRHGAPKAIAGALVEGALSAAQSASRNHRLYVE